MRPPTMSFRSRRPPRWMLVLVAAVGFVTAMVLLSGNGNVQTKLNKQPTTTRDEDAVLSPSHVASSSSSSSLPDKQDMTKIPTTNHDNNNLPPWVACETSKGSFRVCLNPVQSPKSVERLLLMIREKWFELGDGVAFFRVNDVMTQFGVKGREFKSPKPSEWERDLNPQPVKSLRTPWSRGDMAMIGGVHMVIVKKSGTRMGLNNHDTVVGRIPLEDMHVIDELFQYPDIIDHPHGPPGPDQSELYNGGWPYLNAKFPKVDRITRCWVPTIMDDVGRENCK